MVKIAGQALGGDGGRAGDDDVPSGVVMGAGDAGQRGALPGGRRALEMKPAAFRGAWPDKRPSERCR